MGVVHIRLLYSQHKRSCDAVSKSEVLDDDCMFLLGRLCCAAVVLAQHSKLGLEARRRRRVSGRTQTWLHRPKLPCSRLLHFDGKPLHHEVLSSGTYLIRAVIMLDNGQDCATITVYMYMCVCDYT